VYQSEEVGGSCVTTHNNARSVLSPTIYIPFVVHISGARMKGGLLKKKALRHVINTADIVSTTSFISFPNDLVPQEMIPLTSPYALIGVVHFFLLCDGIYRLAGRSWSLIKAEVHLKRTIIDTDQYEITQV
jgi:hypothetical protein